MKTQNRLEDLNQQYIDLLRVERTYAIDGDISGFDVLEVEKNITNAEHRIIVLEIDEKSTIQLQQFNLGHIVKYVAEIHKYSKHMAVIKKEGLEDFQIMILVLLCKGRWVIPLAPLLLKQKETEKNLFKKYEQYIELKKILEIISLEDNIRDGSDIFLRGIEEVNSIKKVTFHFNDKEDKLKPISIESDKDNMNLVAVIMLKYLQQVLYQDKFAEMGFDPIRSDLDVSIPDYSTKEHYIFCYLFVEFFLHLKLSLGKKPATKRKLFQLYFSLLKEAGQTINSAESDFNQIESYLGQWYRKGEILIN